MVAKFNSICTLLNFAAFVTHLGLMLTSRSGCEQVPNQTLSHDGWPMLDGYPEDTMNECVYRMEGGYGEGVIRVEGGYDHFVGYK